jgi:hypothetical protein
MIELRLHLLQHSAFLVKLWWWRRHHWIWGSFQRKRLLVLMLTLMLRRVVQNLRVLMLSPKFVMYAAYIKQAVWVGNDTCLLPITVRAFGKSRHCGVSYVVCIAYCVVWCQIYLV